MEQRWYVRISVRKKLIERKLFKSDLMNINPQDGLIFEKINYGTFLDRQSNKNINTNLSAVNFRF